MAPLPRRRTMLERPVRMRAILEELRWRRPSDGPQIVTIADIAECGCPDWCLRDHENE